MLHLRHATLTARVAMWSAFARIGSTYGCERPGAGHHQFLGMLSNPNAAMMTGGIGAL